MAHVSLDGNVQAESKETVGCLVDLSESPAVIEHVMEEPSQTACNGDAEHCATNAGNVVVSPDRKITSPPDDVEKVPTPPQVFNMEDLMAQDDLDLLDQQEFDFDIPVSPSCLIHSDSEDKVNEVKGTVDDEDEVFFGPVGHVEKCVAAGMDPVENIKPLSPLTEKQLAELVKEAQRVAYNISKDKDKSNNVKDESKRKQLGKCKLLWNSLNSHKEVLGLKKNTDNVMSPGSIKRRETFCVNNSSLPLPPEQVQETLPLIIVDNQNETKDDDHVKPAKSSERKGVSRSATYRVTKSRLAPERNNCQQNSETSVPIKKQKTGIRDSVETSSSRSDVPEISRRKSALGKRCLPQPKVSRLVPPGSSRSHSRTSSNSSISSVGSDFGNKSLNTSLKSSGLKPPSSLNSSVSEMNPNRPKPSLKAPMSKLQLMKAGNSALQRKLLKPDRSKTGISCNNGPMKATATVITKKKTPQNNQGLMSQSSTQKKTVGSRCDTVVSTPFKPDTMVQPRKLLEYKATVGGPVKAGMMTPPNSSTGSGSSCGSEHPSTPNSVKSTKRRSFLPTPIKKLLSAVQSPKSSRSSRSSVGSPVFADENKQTNSPRIGKLISLAEDSPNCLKPRLPLVQHTPQVKTTTTKPSLWSPVKKPKFIAGDEYFACTKRTVAK